MASMFALANPKRFMDASTQFLPWLAGAAGLALAAGLILGFLAPPDYQQGTTVKIMFLHVPAAWTAMMAYG
ncbi:MAG: heme transporter HemC, partial [Rhizomicrobium sp.]